MSISEHYLVAVLPVPVQGLDGEGDAVGQGLDGEGDAVQGLQGGVVSLGSGDTSISRVT